MALQPNITVQVDADTAQALAQILTFSKAAQSSLDGINANIKFDTPENDKEAEDGGRSASKSWWKGFGKESDKQGNAATSRFKRLFQKWSAIVVAFGEDIAVALYGAGGALASISASLVQAIGAAGAFVPIAASLGAAIATIVIGSQGVGDAFSAVNEEFKAAAKEGRAFNVEAQGIQDALKGLAPSAQEFVKAFAGIRTELSGISEFVQQRLFEGLGESLTDLAAKQLPAIQSGLGSIASTLNTAFIDLFDTIGSFNLGGLLTSWTPLISNIAGALAPLSAAFLSFLETATPYALTLSEQFAKWAENLADFVQSAEGTKAIEDFLSRSLDSLNSWLDLIGSVGKALGTFLGIASASGDGLVDSLTKVVDKFNEWMQTTEGMQAVQDFLATSERIVKALAPLLEGIAGAFDALVTEGAVSRFEDLAATLGEILPLLAELLGAVSETNIINVFADAILEIGKALKESGAIEALSKLGKAIGEGLGKILNSIVESGTLDILATGIVILADALIVLLDSFLTPEVLTAFEEGLGALALVVASLTPLVAQLAPMLGEMLGEAIIRISGLIVALAPLFLSVIEAVMPLLDILLTLNAAWLELQSVIVGVIFGVLGELSILLGQLAEFLSVAIVEGVELAVDLFGVLGESLVQVKDVFVSVINVITTAWSGFWEALKSLYKTFFSAFFSDIGGYFRGLVNTFQSAWNTITGAFQSFKDAFGNLWDDLKSAWNDTLEDLREFGRDVVSFFRELPGRAASALSGLVDAITEPFRKAWEKAKEYVDKIKNLPGSIAGGIGGAIGGVFGRIPGLARGGIVTQATKIMAGEAGREAVVPLDRPLAQIDPSVRMMAALLRGEGPKQQVANTPAAPSPGAGMVNNWVINDMTGNAEATAQKVLNRLALV